MTNVFSTAAGGLRVNPGARPDKTSGGFAASVECRKQDRKANQKYSLLKCSHYFVSVISLDFPSLHLILTQGLNEEKLLS